MTRVLIEVEDPKARQLQKAQPRVPRPLPRKACPFRTHELRHDHGPFLSSVLPGYIKATTLIKATVFHLPYL